MPDVLGISDELLARGLGWFSIGLGLIEATMPRKLGEQLGLEEHPDLLRLYGLREITAGIGLLTRQERSQYAPWLLARAAGDGMDIATLLGTLARKPERSANIGIALGAVAGVTLLDALCAQSLTAQNESVRNPVGAVRPDPQKALAPPSPLSYVRYSDDVEVISEDESETIDKILESMHRLSDRTEKQYGHAIRVSHAKSHGAAAGELVVLDNLPEHLRQGLFAQPNRYPVIARLSNVPGEIVSDAVATPRGLAIKILNVEGEMLPGHTGETTQDWVLDTGNRFPYLNVKDFLIGQVGSEPLPLVPEAIKEGVSKASFVANQALHAVGGDSAHLDLFGHPRVHPLAEAYFSQAPIRYGDYIAKLVIVPVSPALTALEKEVLDTSQDENALRTATVNYLRQQEAVFEIRVQLCTDLEKMPVENANTEWNEDESPYQTVARLTFPQQEAYSDARRAYVDEDLSFCMSHSLAAHRPLGSIMRARLRAYPEMSSHRRSKNGKPLTEPRSISEVPE